MYIEQLGEEGSGNGEKGGILGVYGGRNGLVDAKRAVVGAGARVLFYPTLVYNVVRNKIEPGFRWWDRINEFLLLGAVPFPSDVTRLKRLGVNAVVTMNEPYETLVPTSLYADHEIDHLVLPTRDYLFAPTFGDICQAVDFIHENASSGKTTYVHCKAGRGRSTTIVLCYLVQHKQMSPHAAYEYVRLIRPRVLLAASQWQAVQDYYHLRVNKAGSSSCLVNPVTPSSAFLAGRKLVSFDESSFIFVSESDLDGYDGDASLDNGGSMWAELSIVCKVQIAGEAALARLSCFWIRCHAHPEITPPEKKLGRDSCSVEANQLGGGGHSCLMTGVVVKL